MSKRMPIDIKELLGALTSIGNERSLPVNVNLLFDPTASERLVSLILDEFVSVDCDAQVNSIVLDGGLPDIPVPADLSIIVGGDSLLLGDIASASRAKGIPSVVVITRGETFFAEDAAAAAAFSQIAAGPDAGSAPDGVAATGGKGIPISDIVDVDPGAERPLDGLGAWIVSNAPAKRLALASNFAFMRRPLSVELGRECAVQNGAIGIVFFIPGADMPLITLNQARMVLQIAAAYGQPLGTERIREVLAVVASGFGCRAVARKLISFVPVMGWAVKPAVAASGTLAIACAAADYYEGGIVESACSTASKAVSAAANLAGRGVAAANRAAEALKGFCARGAHSPSAE